MRRRNFVLAAFMAPLSIFGFLNTEGPKGPESFLDSTGDRQFFKLVPVDMEDLKKGDMFHILDPDTGFVMENGDTFHTAEANTDVRNVEFIGGEKKRVPAVVCKRHENLREAVNHVGQASV